MSAITITTRDGIRGELTREIIKAFRSRIKGQLLFPGDDGFSAATLIWNGMIKKTPALVLRPAGIGDVTEAVNFARDNGILFSLKGGGHNIAGTALADGGLTLDMSSMSYVTVDPDVRLVNVGPGCLLGDVDVETQKYGLATVLGFISQTGVAGLTLGGGLGYLARRFGWTVDNLEEVEIVTADGVVRTANRRENADLFWALRGGGGNFGIVTRFTFRLHEVGPTVYGGLIAWPFERADEILRAYRTITAESPRELSVWMLLVHAPAAPFVPQEWHGARSCAFAVCYTGDLTHVDEVMSPIRALGEPVVNLLREQPYVQIQSYLNDNEPKGMHYYWKTEFASELSDELLATTRDLFAECPIPEADLGFLHIGGALNELDWEDGAVGNRDVRYAIGMNGMWEPDEPRADMFRQWIRDAWNRIRRYSLGRTYINFQTADEDEERIRATYGKNYHRLVEVKKKYDPDNIFRSNRNIVPKS
jgi:FAD/FMN-containing dehydrogenase